jgi:hypothetical protein
LPTLPFPAKAMVIGGIQNLLHTMLHRASIAWRRTR